MSLFPCPACHATAEPHRSSCPIATCHYCGHPLKESWPTGHSRSGLMLCPDCHVRLPACPVCFGTGMTLASETHTVVLHDPCSECHGDGFIASNDSCAYSGYRYCAERGCPDCTERARIAAEDRIENLAKHADLETRIDDENARAWGRRS